MTPPVVHVNFVNVLFPEKVEPAAKIASANVLPPESVVSALNVATLVNVLSPFKVAPFPLNVAPPKVFPFPLIVAPSPEKVSGEEKSLSKLTELLTSREVHVPPEREKPSPEEFFPFRTMFPPETMATPPANVFSPLNEMSPAAFPIVTAPPNVFAPVREIAFALPFAIEVVPVTEIARFSEPVAPEVNSSSVNFAPQFNAVPKFP